MTEFNHGEAELVKRLKDHYQNRYEQEPDPSLFWARVLPHLDQQESRQPGLLQRVQWLPGSLGRFAARQKVALKATYKEYSSMEEAMRIDNAQHYDPHFTLEKRPLRRRIQHIVEAGLAAVLVASLLLGWFVITSTHSVQGKPTPLFSFTAPTTTRPGQSGMNSQWLPDGKHLASAVGNAETHTYRYMVWDATTGKARQTAVINVPSFSSTINPVAIPTLSPDGRYGLIQTYDTTSQLTTIKVVNVLTGHIEVIYQGHLRNIVPIEAVFSNDNKYLAFVSGDEHIRFWDLAMGKVVRAIGPDGVSQVQHFEWSDDSKRIIGLTAPNAADNQPEGLQEWDVQTGQRIAHIVATPSMSLTLGVAEHNGFSPDGLRVFTFNVQAGTFEIRESSTLKVLQTFHVQLQISGSISPSGILSGSYIFPSWLGNGERVFLGKDQQLFIWDAASGKLLKTYSLVGAPVSVPEVTIAYTGGEGPYMAFWQQGKQLEIKNAVTDVKVSTIDLIRKASEGYWIYWSERGKHLNINFTPQDAQGNFANNNRQGWIYDTISGKLLATYQGQFAQLSNDGKYLAVEQDQVDPKSGHTVKSTLEILSVH